MGTLGLDLGEQRGRETESEWDPVLQYEEKRVFFLQQFNITLLMHVQQLDLIMDVLQRARLDLVLHFAK